MAAAKPAVHVRGLKELRRAVAKLDEGVHDLTEVGRSAAEIVLGEARTLVPRESGDLGRSMRTWARSGRSAVAAGKRAVPYAGVIHFGWPAHNIKPQPFLYKALDRRHDEVVAVYEERMAELVRRLDRETPPL